MKTPRFITQATIEVESDSYFGFYVDIVLDTKEEVWYLWLFHEGYTIKEMIYGTPVHNYRYKKIHTVTLAEIMEDINYHAEQSIPMFVEDYMDC